MSLQPVGPAVSLHNYSFSYAGMSYHSLRDISLDIAAGSVVVLAGASGCGKTTLIRALGGLIPGFFEGESEGAIRVAGFDVTQVETWDVARVASTVFQNPRTQFFTTDVRSELAFGCENLGLPATETKRRVDRAVAVHDLSELVGRSVFTLSGGEKQRLACGSVAAMETPVVLLDEPSANLDAASTAGLRAVIARWKQAGRTVVVAEHRLHYLRELADAVVIMADGAIAEQLTGEDFRKLDEVRTAQLGLRTIRLADVIQHLGDTVDRDPGQTTQPYPPVNHRTDTIHQPCDGQKPDRRQVAHPGPSTNPMIDASRGVSLRDVRVSRKRRALPGQVARQCPIEVLSVPQLVLPAGEVTAVVGPNGAGKSTLASFLAGLGPKQPGSLTLDGQRLDWKKRREICYLVQQDVSHQLFTESALREVELACRSDETASARDVLAQVNLQDLAERHPLSLSAGQRQRLAVACALASRRPVTIFDEPTSGLDLIQMHAVAVALRRLADQGRVVVVITHDLELVATVASHAVEIEAGRVTRSYPLDEPGWAKMVQHFTTQFI